MKDVNLYWFLIVNKIYDDLKKFLFIGLRFLLVVVLGCVLRNWYVFFVKLLVSNYILKCIFGNVCRIYIWIDYFY